MFEVAEKMGLSKADILALRHVIVSADQWLADAVQGQDQSAPSVMLRNKAAACRARMAKEAVDTFLADPEVVTMPATEEALILALAARPDYRDRRQRDEEAFAAVR